LAGLQGGLTSSAFASQVTAFSWASLCCPVRFSSCPCAHLCTPSPAVHVASTSCVHRRDLRRLQHARCLLNLALPGCYALSQHPRVHTPSLPTLRTAASCLARPTAMRALTIPSCGSDPATINSPPHKPAWSARQPSGPHLLWQRWPLAKSPPSLAPFCLLHLLLCASLSPFPHPSASPISCCPLLPCRCMQRPPACGVPACGQPRPPALQPLTPVLLQPAERKGYTRQGHTSGGSFRRMKRSGVGVVGAVTSQTNTGVWAWVCQGGYARKQGRALSAGGLS